MQENCEEEHHSHKDEIVRWANNPIGTTLWYWSAGDKGTPHNLTTPPSWVKDDVYIVDDHQAELRKALYLDPSLQVEELDPTCKTWKLVKATYKDIDPNKEYRLKPKFKRCDIVDVNNFAVRLLKVCGDEVEYLTPYGTAYNTCTVNDIRGMWKPSVGDFVYVNGDIVKISKVNVSDLLVVDSTGERTYIKHVDIDRVWYPRCDETVMVIEGATKTFLATVMYYLKDGTVNLLSKGNTYNMSINKLAPYVGFEVNC